MAARQVGVCSFDVVLVVLAGASARQLVRARGGAAGRGGARGHGAGGHEPVPAALRTHRVDRADGARAGGRHAVGRLPAAGRAGLRYVWWSACSAGWRSSRRAPAAFCSRDRWWPPGLRRDARGVGRAWVPSPSRWSSGRCSRSGPWWRGTGPPSGAVADQPGAVGRRTAGHGSAPVGGEPGGDAGPDGGAVRGGLRAVRARCRRAGRPGGAGAALRRGPGRGPGARAGCSGDSFAFLGYSVAFGQANEQLSVVHGARLGSAAGHGCGPTAAPGPGCGGRSVRCWSSSWPAAWFSGATTAWSGGDDATTRTAAWIRARTSPRACPVNATGDGLRWQAALDRKPGDRAQVGSAAATAGVQVFLLSAHGRASGVRGEFRRSCRLGSRATPARCSARSAAPTRRLSVWVVGTLPANGYRAGVSRSGPGATSTTGSAPALVFGPSCWACWPCWVGPARGRGAAPSAPARCGGREPSRSAEGCSHREAGLVLAGCRAGRWSPGTRRSRPWVHRRSRRSASASTARSAWRGWRPAAC